MGFLEGAIIGGIGGLIVGANIGVGIMAMMQVAKKSDEQMEKAFEEHQKKNK